MSNRVVSNDAVSNNAVSNLAVSNRATYVSNRAVSNCAVSNRAMSNRACPIEQCPIVTCPKGGHPLSPRLSLADFEDRLGQIGGCLEKYAPAPAMVARDFNGLECTVGFPAHQSEGRGSGGMGGVAAPVLY